MLMAMPQPRMKVGILLSPRERRMFAAISVLVAKTAPPQMMEKNAVALSSSSSGVCMSSSSGRQAKKPTMLKKTAMTKESAMHAAALSRTPVASFAP